MILNWTYPKKKYAELDLFWDSCSTEESNPNDSGLNPSQGDLPQIRDDLEDFMILSH